MSAAETIQALLNTARKGERTIIVGILNVTPDSFSDGGEHHSVDSAVRHAEHLLAGGADILDIGGEFSRPATFHSDSPLPPDEEKRRILPVIAAIAERYPDMPISVDTYKADVARAALEAGAVFINDISALRADPDMAALAAQTRSPVCLMHLPGLPTRLSREPDGVDIVAVVRDRLQSCAGAAIRAGIPPEHIVLDPGFGFGKSLPQNLDLLQRLRELTALGYPLLVGTSRKSMIGKVLEAPPGLDRRVSALTAASNAPTNGAAAAFGGNPIAGCIEGNAAAVALSIANGAALVRVHDVAEMALAVRMTDAVVRRKGGHNDG